MKQKKYTKKWRKYATNDDKKQKTKKKKIETRWRRQNEKVKRRN